MHKNNVSLTVPAQPDYARSVRMMAASLAVLSDLSVDDIEDIRMAAQEGFVRACSTEPESCEVSFTLSTGELAIDFSLGDTQASTENTDTQYADLLLSAVCDEYLLDSAKKTLHLAKRTAVLHDN